MKKANFIIAYGNPVDGFFYVGPFPTAQIANEYTESELFQGYFWIIELQAPAQEENELC